MSPLFRPDPRVDHGRARELAALRADDPLPPVDGAWLDDHLEACDDCRVVAAAYDEQHLLFASLRASAPEPPRDLWARTAAAIEADGSRGAPVGTRVGRLGWRLGPRSLAPVAGLLVVAVAVGAGLLNGVVVAPGAGRAPGADSPAPATPIPLTAGDVRVLARGADGVLELRTKAINEVCPVGKETCGASGASDRLALADIGNLESFDPVLSPGSDQVVLMARGDGAGGVFVVPVRRVDDATPKPATAAPDPSSSADASPAGSPDQSASPAVPGSLEPSVPPDGTPAPSPAVTPEPSVAVTAAPDGRLEIARDVILVGPAAGYSPDGSRFAFTARPADGAAGPDVFLWRTTDAEAHPVTSDHASVFVGWSGRRMLVSRVIDGAPVTVLLNPASGAEQPLPNGAAWRPTVSPDGRTATWWDGTLERTTDGHTHRPLDGRLVLGTWPEPSGEPQVLAADPLADWDVHWDDEGTVLGVWTTKGAPGAAGRLSLYAVDPETGRADLDHPLLADQPAFDGFSLRTGRLAWNAPTGDGEATLKVWAWSGDTRGELRLATESGVTIVP